MIKTSTISIPAQTKESLGVVLAEGVSDIFIDKEIFASIRNFFGGRSRAYQISYELEQLRKKVTAEMVKQAEQLGANGIEGVRLSYFALPAGKKTLLGISIAGTAVIIEKDAATTQTISRLDAGNTEVADAGNHGKGNVIWH